MIPLDKQHTGMSPSTAFNLTQLKFESANSSESESNMVWIILFSLLIFISVLSNSLYILYNIRRRCVTHTILSVFFHLNLLDYVLLIIEFSSEHSGQFSHSEAWCPLYQLLLQTAPLLTSVTIVFLIYQAWGLPSLSRTPALPCATHSAVRAEPDKAPLRPETIEGITTLLQEVRHLAQPHTDLQE